MSQFIYSKPVNKLRIPPPPPTWRSCGTDPIKNPFSRNQEYEHAMESYLKGIQFARHVPKGSTSPTKIVYDVDPDISHVYPEPDLTPSRRKIEISFKPHKSNQTIVHGENPTKSDSCSQSFNFRPNAPSLPICRCDCHKRVSGTSVNENIQTMTTRKTMTDEMKQMRTKDIGQVVKEITIQAHEFDDIRSEVKKNQSFRPKLIIVTRDTKNWDAPRDVTVMDDLYRDLMFEKRVLSHSKFIRQVYDSEFLLDGSPKTLKQPKLLLKPVGLHIQHILPSLPFQDDMGKWQHPDILAIDNQALTKAAQLCVKFDLAEDMKQMKEKQRRQKEKLRLVKEKEKKKNMLMVWEKSRVDPAPKLNLLEALDAKLDREATKLVEKRSRRLRHVETVPYQQKPNQQINRTSSTAQIGNQINLTFPAPFNHVPFRLPFIPPPSSSVTPMQPQVNEYDPANPGFQYSNLHHEVETASNLSSSIHTPLYSVLTAYRYSPK